MGDLLTIGGNSLLSNQAAMTVVGQNIANVSTPNYARRLANFQEGAYYTGVYLGNANRVYNQSSSMGLQFANAGQSAADIHLSLLQNLEGLVDTSISDDPSNPSGTSVGKYFSDMINALNQLNTNPESSQARQLYMSQISILTSRFNQLSTNIQQQYYTVNTQLQQDITQVNQITQQLAQINGLLQIPNSQDTADLLDQQETLLQNLSTYLDYQRVMGANGELNIVLDNGTTLVLGTSYNSMSTMTDPLDPNDQVPTVIIGNNPVNVQNVIGSGEISGLLNFQSDLDDAMHGVGRLALGLAYIMNTQNQLGVDLNGNLGGDVLTDVNDSNLMASRVFGDLQNTGSASVTVSIQNVSQLTSSDYLLDFSAPNQYQLTRISDGVIVSSGTMASYPATITADGMQVTVAADTYNVGDVFRLSPTNNAALSLNLQITDTSALALGFPVSVFPMSSNAGSGAIQVTSMVSTATPEFSVPGQLNPPITIQFLSSSSYQIVNATTHAVMEGPLTYNQNTGVSVFPTPGGYDPGYRVSLTGQMVTGDTFHLQYNSNPNGDNRNGRMLTETVRQGLFDSGVNTFSQAYNLYASDISTRGQAANIVSQSATILYTQALTQVEQVSGVNLEEETINLAQYQQAYQACAQIIEAARVVFEALMSISRGA